MFTAASETFNQKNINCTIAESIERFKPVVARAKKEKLIVRAYISTALHCPYEGAIAPERVVAVAARLLTLGVDELSIGDTIGKGSPLEGRRLLDELLRAVNARTVILHFHDTYGMAVANALTAWQEYGITAFDSSAGALGGCPYAPGASGNVATEDLAFALKASRAQISIDLDKLREATRILEPHLGHGMASHLGRIQSAKG